MRHILNTNHPVGGMWTYTQPETGVTLADWSWAAFLKKIRDHRKACELSVEPGWVDEIHEDVITNNPKLEWEEVGSKRRWFTGDDIRRFLTTMNELRKHGEMVSEEEHRRRLDICAVCPKNGQISCGGCGWLAKELTALMGRRRVHRAPEVFRRSCLACGCDITSKALMPMAVLKQVDEKIGSTPEYAPGCWMLEGN